MPARANKRMSTPMLAPALEPELTAGWGLGLELGGVEEVVVEIEVADEDEIRAGSGIVVVDVLATRDVDAVAAATAVILVKKIR